MGKEETEEDPTVKVIGPQLLILESDLMVDAQLLGTAQEQ